MTSDSVVQTQSPESPTFSRIWWLYFMLSIIVLTPLTLYITAVPFYVLSLVNPKFRRWGDVGLQRSVQTLFFFQPWLNLKTDVKEFPENALLVSNHRSHLDVFILLYHIPGIRVLAKLDLFKIPFLGFMMKCSRQIPVHASRLDSVAQAMETVRSRLAEKEIVHIFPEFTRCPAGLNGVQNFTLAPFHIAFQEKRPVVPLVFKNTDGVWPKGKSAISFQAPIELKSLPAVYPGQFESVQKFRTAVQESIARAL